MKTLIERLQGQNSRWIVMQRRKPTPMLIYSMLYRSKELQLWVCRGEDRRVCSLLYATPNDAEVCT